jgi:predicted alpha/beta superfamily hydrolase
MPTDSASTSPQQPHSHLESGLPVRVATRVGRATSRGFRMVGESWTLGVAMCLASLATAQERIDVAFEVTQSTSVGQSVYVLGSLPELGSSNITRAVKLEPSLYPRWRVTISVPTNRAYTYQYYIRSDAPAQQRVPTNGIALGTPSAGFHAAPVVPPQSKLLLYRGGFSAPILWWRQDSGAYSATPMLEVGEGRNVNERLWAGFSASSSADLGVGVANVPIEYYITSATGREPTSGSYITSLDAALLQDGQVFSYVPTGTPAAQRRDYNPSSPPTIASANLNGEVRTFRVLLPRGYDQHPTRRYPVVYMHDGQNVFESGPFGTWSADVAASLQVRSGAMRECILVGVDNTSNRLIDYLPPQDGGRADRYVRFLRDELKPLIDSRYRTLPGADNTGAIGSSMGGVVSLYMGWDFSTTYTRLGVMSGAWQTTQIDARAVNESKRPVRLWIDSGDSGTADDNYWLSFNLRDGLTKPNHPGGAYAIGNDVWHMVGFNQQHNEPAWAQRIGTAFSFLFPGREEPSALLSLRSVLSFDRTGDSRVTVDDLYALSETPTDINGDGAVTPGDTAALRSVLRRDERADLLSTRR